MNDLDKNTILHIAKLSKISLSEKEIERFRKELSSIIDYFKKLNEINTSDTEPTSQTTGVFNIIRDDLVRIGLSPEEALKNAPKKSKKYIKTFSPLNGK